MTIKAGDLVCWSEDIRDLSLSTIKNYEVFTVRTVHPNGRCDLVDRTGAQLFNILLSHLQLLNDRQART